MKKPVPSYGAPVSSLEAPSHAGALSLLLSVEKLLASGKRKDVARAKAVLADANNYEVWSRNMLNPKAGLFPIGARDFGSCCDPSSESYHCM